MGCGGSCWHLRTGRELLECRFCLPHALRQGGQIGAARSWRCRLQDPDGGRQLVELLAERCLRSGLLVLCVFQGRDLWRKCGECGAQFPDVATQ
ncbi:hypothetical protein D3C76_1437630 [compost metagenome]